MSNSDLKGVDFMVDGVKYRVTKILNDVAFAGKVNPETGKVQRGRTRSFNVQRVRLLSQEMAKVEQLELPIESTETIE